MRMMANTDPGKRSNGMEYLGMGFVLGTALAVPAGLGYALDRWVGTLPLFLLLGIVLGFVSGLYYVYRALKRVGG